MKRHFRELSVAAALALLLLVLALAAPAFFAKQQLLTTLTTAAPVLIAACGMALVIIARQIDISIGSQFALCSIFAGLLAQAGMPMPVVALGAIAGGAALGACNGALVAGLGLPSIVVTLATMVTWREALRWWREGEFVKDLPERFQWFGFGQAGGQAAILLGAVLVFGALAFAMKHLAAGRFVYAVGSDREAARLAGLRPQSVTFAVFVLMARSSVLPRCSTPSASPTWTRRPAPDSKCRPSPPRSWVAWPSPADAAISGACSRASCCCRALRRLWCF